MEKGIKMKILASIKKIAVPFWLFILLFFSSIFLLNIKSETSASIEPGCYVKIVIPGSDFEAYSQLKSVDQASDPGSCNALRTIDNDPPLESGKCYGLIAPSTRLDFNCSDPWVSCETSSTDVDYYAHSDELCLVFLSVNPELKPESSSGSSTSLDDSALEGSSESLHQADDSKSGKFFSYLTIIFTVFSALAGIAMVASLVVAGIQYATAGDNAGAISKAKSRIVYTLITLLLYVMLFYIVTWLIPSDIIT